MRVSREIIPFLTNTHLFSYVIECNTMMELVKVSRKCSYAVFLFLYDRFL